NEDALDERDPIRLSSICALAKFTTAQVPASVSSPASSRASRVISCRSVKLKSIHRPCRSAFKLERHFPARERGPVLRAALRRFASLCRALVIDPPQRTSLLGQWGLCLRLLWRTRQRCS